MEAMDVIGLGASTVDLLSLVEHLPAEDENMRAIDISVQGGGPVATAIVTLARLGARTAMIDAIGDDWRGTLIREEFRREGVAVEHLKIGRGWTSPTSCILVKQEDGARSIIWAPGSAPDLTAAELPRAAITSAKFLHVNGRHEQACLEAVKIAHEAGVQVSFDGGAGRYRPALREIVPLSDVCIVAREFAERYTSETDVTRAANKLMSSGPRLVVITEGTRGSRVYSKAGSAFHQPAYLLPKAVDTTGCGDSYHGAFLFGLLKGWELQRTAAFASAVAAINSQTLGGRGGLPTYDQTEAFLAERKKQ
jgi:sugar/nucleoside kinase (ribokinase family)